jgi:hypothetical protein
VPTIGFTKLVGILGPQENRSLMVPFALIARLDVWKAQIAVLKSCSLVAAVLTLPNASIRDDRRVLCEFAAVLPITSTFGGQLRMADSATLCYSDGDVLKEGRASGQRNENRTRFRRPILV